jgi:alpha-N-arabinofuranosidase
MRGSSLDVYVTTPPDSSSTIYTGPTVPKFIQDLTLHTPDSKKLTKFVDVSAVLATADDTGFREIRISIVNKNETKEYDVPLVFGRDVNVKEDIVVYEVWHENLKATNWFGDEKVRTVERKESFSGIYRLKKHSFQSESSFLNRKLFTLLTVGECSSRVHACMIL